MNPAIIAHMTAHRIATQRRAMQDRVDCLMRLRDEGSITADMYTNQRTLVTLLSLIDAGFVQRDDHVFTLSQAGQDMISRKPQ